MHRESIIYTEVEAKEAGIEYVYWRDCNEVGSYGLSDDGYVCELLGRCGYKTTDCGYWSFSGGIVKVYKHVYKKNASSSVELIVGPLLTGERKAKKIEEAMKTAKAREILRAYLLHDKKIDVAVMSVLPAAPMVELNKWRTVAKSEVFKMAVKEEILSLLEQSGFSRQRAILLLDEAIQMAREKKDVGNMMRAVENLFDVLGFKDKDTKKESIEHTTHSIEKLADSVLEEKDTVKLTREVPLVDILEEE